MKKLNTKLKAVKKNMKKNETNSKKQRFEKLLNEIEKITMQFFNYDGDGFLDDLETKIHARLLKVFDDDYSCKTVDFMIGCLKSKIANAVEKETKKWHSIFLPDNN